jgi:protein AATF/BFR2
VSTDVLCELAFPIIGSARPSTLRKLHDGISDPKYDGVKTTRKRLLQEDVEEGNEEGSAAEGEGFSEHSREEDQPSEELSANEICSRSNGDNQEPPPASQNVSLNKSVQDYRPSDDLTSTLQKTRDEDRKKGRAISRQLVRFTRICLNS